MLVIFRTVRGELQALALLSPAKYQTQIIIQVWHANAIMASVATSRGMAPMQGGRCIPAPCNIENSNKQPGLSCKCADGFHGNIAWKGDIPTDSCKHAACSIADSTREPGLKCKLCQWLPGQDHMEWPECRRPPAFRPRCNINTSNKQPGLSCKCADGFDGDIVWNGGIPTGSCTPAKCGIPQLDWQRPRLQLCLQVCGGTSPGQVPFLMVNVFRPLATSRIPTRRLDPSVPAPMGYKAKGPVVQTFLKVLSAVCVAIPCEGERSNHQDGPGCRCADGYNGTVQLGTTRTAGFSKFSKYLFSKYLIRRKSSAAFKADSCVPAKCVVENTIGDGKECRCKDGYQGSVTWVGPNAVGACKPAHCSIENSNGKPGLECKCLDGYGGSISTDVESHFWKACLT